MPREVRVTSLPLCRRDRRGEETCPSDSPGVLAQFAETIWARAAPTAYSGNTSEINFATAALQAAGAAEIGTIRSRHPRD